MRPRLYISWGNWLGARAAELLDAAVRSAYGDHASTFYSAEIKDGDNWFTINESELDKASAAVVLISSDGLESHWQAYELGRLRGKGVPCILLLLDVAANELGSTVFVHLNCKLVTENILHKIIRTGLDAEGGGEDLLGHQSDREASSVLGFRLRSLIDAFVSLQQYKIVTGRTMADHALRHGLIQQIVHGFCAAGLEVDKIEDKLTRERVPGALYVTLLEDSPCKT